MADLVPVAILVGAVVGGVVAWYVAMTRSTIDFISRHEIGNPRWRAVIQEVKALVLSDDPDLLPSLARETHPSGRRQEQRQAVEYMLNYFEAVAVAIRYRAISRRIYKAWNKTGYMLAWPHLEPFAEARRTKTGQITAYTHFEKLAKKWAGRA